MYRKEIIYMNLFENEVKKECVGYLKIEKRQDRYQAEVQVKKLPTETAGNFPIRLQDETGWQETGPLAIKEGTGKWNGVVREPVFKAEIRISDTDSIRGESKNAQTVPEQYQQEQKKEEQEKEEKKQEEIVKQEELIENERHEKPDKTPDETKNVESPVLRAESMAAPIKAVLVKPAREKTEPKKVAVRKTAVADKPLYENKWEQLLSTYEQIHPYGDARVYVKLEPKDFIVLRENYQHLVNNSFLLHGFYNYRYLILGKEGGFYLGVPGVFYEREKMVALMFGFEAFECEGGEAEEGKFGYYLRKVEL